MMLPDLVAAELQAVSAARPPATLTLVRFDNELGDPASATRPHLGPRRTAKAIARAAFVIAAGIGCLLLLIGVVINVLAATP
jgi:hypothetical protein